MKYDYDIAIIGAGPAGQWAAIELARNGARVAVIERRSLAGGVCLHVGTVPSKTLREAVMALTGYRHNAMFGNTNQSQAETIEASKLIAYINGVIEKEISVISNQFQMHGIDLIFGNAHFIDDHTIETVLGNTNTKITANKFIIATGTVAYRPPMFEFDDKKIIDSDQLFNMEHLPRRMIIVGAGIIGTEYASIFSMLGIEVTVINRGSSVLPFLDDDCTHAMLAELEKRNVKILNDTTVKSCKVSNGQPLLETNKGETLVADMVMVASGRSGTANELNLQAVGIQPTQRGLIEVNERYQTSNPNIYAAGDIIGFPSLAATSKEQGRRLAHNILGLHGSTKEHVLPFGIYTIPEIAFVGKTEQELSNENTPYFVGISRFGEIAKGEIIGDNTGLMKLIFHKDSQKLLGAHSVGTAATEIIHVAAAAIHFEADINYFLESIFNYPTLSESYKMAAYNAAYNVKEKE